MREIVFLVRPCKSGRSDFAVRARSGSAAYPVAEGADECKLNTVWIGLKWLQGLVIEVTEKAGNVPVFPRFFQEMGRGAFCMPEVYMDESGIQRMPVNS